MTPWLPAAIAAFLIIVCLTYKLGQSDILLGQKLRQFCNDHAKWSTETFGRRGPIGPLKHLALEVQECLDKPDDLEEYADCMLLLVDASRRAGFDIETLLDASIKKLAKCKKRQWSVSNGDEPSLHVK